MEIKQKLLVAVGVIVIGFFIALAVFNVNESFAPAAPTTYTGLPKDNRFIEESGSGIVRRFEDGTGIIFLGSTSCPWCQKAAPLLNEAAEAENISVHHLDIRKERENQPAIYSRIISILTPYLPKDENGLPTISTPDISFVKDGEIIWRYEVEETEEYERTPETYWTKERQDRAIARFKEEIARLK